MKTLKTARTQVGMKIDDLFHDLRDLLWVFVVVACYVNNLLLVVVACYVTMLTLVMLWLLFLVML